MKYVLKSNNKSYVLKANGKSYILAVNPDNQTNGDKLAYCCYRPEWVSDNEVSDYNDCIFVKPEDFDSGAYYTYYNGVLEDQYSYGFNFENVITEDSAIIRQGAADSSTYIRFKKGDIYEPYLPKKQYTLTIIPPSDYYTIEVNGQKQNSITVTEGAYVKYGLFAEGEDYPTRFDWVKMDEDKTIDFTKESLVTLTVNPTPADAVVTLTCGGYSQNGNSISVPMGSMINWSVSSSGYKTKEGSYRLYQFDDSLNVKLDAESSGDILYYCYEADDWEDYNPNYPPNISWGGEIARYYYVNPKTKELKYNAVNYRELAESSADLEIYDEVDTVDEEILFFEFGLQEIHGTRYRAGDLYT